MRCPNCQTELENGAVFCHECGTRVAAQPQPARAMFCSNCGEKLEEGSIFCSNCGARVEVEEDDGEDFKTAAVIQMGVPSMQSTDQSQSDYKQQSTSQPQQSYVQQSAGQPQQKTDKEKASGSKEGSGTNKAPVIAAVVIGIILIIVCILVAVKLINKEKDSDKTEDAQSTAVENVDVDEDDENVDDADEAGDVIAPETEESVSVTPKPTATPTPEPTEEPLTISVADAQPDISSYFKVNVSAATATSTIVQQGHDNSALKAFDGDQTSSWQEGVDGYGIGEGITGYFDKAYNVKYIFLKLGNWRDATNNIENSRPQTITIICDGFTQEFTFPDEQREFYIELSKEVSMTYIDIKINAVYPGSKYDDTVIADVAIYGK